MCPVSMQSPHSCPQTVPILVWLTLIVLAEECRPLLFSTSSNPLMTMSWCSSLSIVKKFLKPFSTSALPSYRQTDMIYNFFGNKVDHCSCGTWLCSLYASASYCWKLPHLTSDDSLSQTQKLLSRVHWYHFLLQNSIFTTIHMINNACLSICTFITHYYHIIMWCEIKIKDISSCTVLWHL